MSEQDKTSPQETTGESGQNPEKEKTMNTGKPDNETGQTTERDVKQPPVARLDKDKSGEIGFPDNFLMY
jgi:hypothetical protein